MGGGVMKLIGENRLRRTEPNWTGFGPTVRLSKRLHQISNDAVLNAAFATAPATASKFAGSLIVSMPKSWELTSPTRPLNSRTWWFMIFTNQGPSGSGDGILSTPTPWTRHSTPRKR